MIRRNLVQLVTAVCLVLAAAQPAGAADYSLRSCSQSPLAGLTAAGKGWSTSTPSSSAPGAAIGSCPAGLSFNSKSATGGATGSWSFTFKAIPSMVHFKFDYEGGETSGGWKYSISDCASTCKELQTLPARAAGAPPGVFELDVSNPTLIKVTAKCDAATCSASEPLVFHDVVASVSDIKPPQASVSTNATYWIDPRDATASISISDNGGMGLSTSTARIDDGESFFGRDACSFAVFIDGSGFLPTNTDSVCGQSISWPEQRLPLAGVGDGIHSVIVDAVDVAGNVMPTFTRKVYLDGTPPVTPEDIVLSGVNEFGWTQLASVGATWTNAGEEAMTTLQSGIDAPAYERQPAPGFSGESATVPGVFEVDTVKSLKAISLPTDARWNVYIWVTDRAGNKSGRAKVTVGRDRGVPAAPVLDEGSWMNQSALNGFRQGLTQPAGGEISGVCGYAVSVDDDPGTIPAGEISQLGALNSLWVSPATADGANWLHARAISCAGVASPTSSRQVLVDRQPPRVYVGGLPSSEWTNHAVALHASATDPLSGVKGVALGLTDDPAPTPGDTADLVVPEGHHTVRLSAVDNAANVTPTAIHEVRFDATAPEAAIDASAATDPAKLSGIVSDTLSGVAAAVFEFRRSDSAGPWTVLPTATAGDAAAAQVSAVIPDADLDPGAYEFRLRVSDVAGNAKIVQTPSRSLPARGQPTLKVQLATIAGCKPRSKCSSPASRVNRRGAKRQRTVKYGQRVAVVGELRDAGGAPVGGALLKVYAAPGGVNRELVGTVATDARGRYVFLPKRGPNRRFTVTNAGTPTRLPATGFADLDVAVGATLDVNRSSVRFGQRVIFSGRVLGGTAAYSPAGLRVNIEFFLPGAGWHPAVDHPLVRPDGRFVAEPYYFKGTATSPVTRKFRVLVPTRSSRFPYVEGYSNVRTIRVAP